MTLERMLTGQARLDLETARSDTAFDKAKADCRHLANSSARILLTDDQLTNRQVALGMLSQLGLRADTATDGQEAIAALKTQTYDLVLMDVQMPILDGLEATRRIRAGETGAINPEVVIVAMTAHAMAGDREQCLAVGMNDYLAKPIDPAALGAVLHRWLPNVPDDPPAIIPHPPDTLVNAQPLGEDRAIWDKPALLERLMGDESLVQEIVASYLEDLPDQINQLQTLIEQADLAAVKAQAHRIKGAAANMGALAISNSALAIEKAEEMTAVINELLVLRTHFSALQAIMIHDRQA